LSAITERALSQFGLCGLQNLQFIDLKPQHVAPNILGLKEGPGVCGLDITGHRVLRRIAGAHAADGECDGKDANVDSD
jgi:hypothetical protein